MPRSIEEFVQLQEDKIDDVVRDAIVELAEARRELERIEEQLVLASENKPFLRISRVEHLDAAPIFAAFAQIELVAKLKRNLL